MFKKCSTTSHNGYAQTRRSKYTIAFRSSSIKIHNLSTSRFPYVVLSTTHFCGVYARLAIGTHNIEDWLVRKIAIVTAINATRV